MKKIKAAAIQFCATLDSKKNMQLTTNLILNVYSEYSPDFIVIPENFYYMGPAAGKLEIAETLEGKVINRLRELSKKISAHILVGGFPEISLISGKTYNTAVLISDKGEIVATYRKIHLFDVTGINGVTRNESNSTLAGDKTVVADTDIGKIGLSICYDLRFPELYRKLSNKNVEIITVPAAFTESTGQAHWEVLLRARAIENQSYVIAANQIGTHYGSRKSFGNSMIIDPWGTVIAHAGNNQGYTVAVCDPAYLSYCRTIIPSLKNRKIK